MLQRFQGNSPVSALLMIHHNMDWWENLSYLAVILQIRYREVLLPLCRRHDLFHHDIGAARKWCKTKIVFNLNRPTLDNDSRQRIECDSHQFAASSHSWRTPTGRHLFATSITRIDGRWTVAAVQSNWNCRNERGFRCSSYVVLKRFVKSYTTQQFTQTVRSSAYWWQFNPAPMHLEVDSTKLGYMKPVLVCILLPKCHIGDQFTVSVCLSARIIREVNPSFEK